jgi:hypothetical protein
MTTYASLSFCFFGSPTPSRVSFPSLEAVRKAYEAVKNTHGPKARLINSVVETDPKTGEHRLRLHDKVIKETLKWYSKDQG